MSEGARERKNENGKVRTKESERKRQKNRVFQVENEQKTKNKNLRNPSKAYVDLAAWHSGCSKLELDFRMLFFGFFCRFSMADLSG